MARLIDADSLMERFRIVAQSGGPVVVHVSDICAAIEDEVYEGNVDAVEVVHGHKVVHSRYRGIAYAMECPICHSKIPSNKPFQENVEYCSVCGKKLDDTFQNYCPNCGAKMDGDGNV